jgi:hypothetical protein
MESLELELVAEGPYDVTIIDYETGLSHKIKVVPLSKPKIKVVLLSRPQCHGSTTVTVTRSR